MQSHAWAENDDLTIIAFHTQAKVIISNQSFTHPFDKIKKSLNDFGCGSTNTAFAIDLAVSTVHNAIKNNNEKH
jgi:hypothetical protein